MCHFKPWYSLNVCGYSIYNFRSGGPCFWSDCALVRSYKPGVCLHVCNPTPLAFAPLIPTDWYSLGVTIGPYVNKALLIKNG